MLPKFASCFATPGITKCSGHKYKKGFSSPPKERNVNLDM